MLFLKDTHFSRTLNRFVCEFSLLCMCMIAFNSVDNCRMERMCQVEKLQVLVRAAWSDIWAPKLLQQSKQEFVSNSRLKKVMEMCLGKMVSV